MKGDKTGKPENNGEEGGSKWFAEEKIIPDFWSWVILILFSGGLMAWGVVVYLFVHDGPRHWDYGKMVDTPGESAYWTHEPAKGPAKSRQMPEFPGAQPLKPQEKSIQEKRR